MPNRLSLDSLWYWVHVVGLLAGLTIAVYVFVRLWRMKPCPYGTPVLGKGDRTTRQYERIIRSILPSLVLATAVFIIFLIWIAPLRAQRGQATSNDVAIILFAVWIANDLYRGIIHPWLTRGAEPEMVRNFAPGAPAPMLLYSYLAASHLGAETYPEDWLSDPRFVIGAAIMVAGIITGQWIDLYLWRQRHEGVKTPAGGFYKKITCPDFLAEVMFWFGWALASWSLAGLDRAIYRMAIFVPLARAHWRYYEHDQKMRRHYKLIPYVW